MTHRFSTSSDVDSPFQGNDNSCSFAILKEFFKSRLPRRKLLAMTTYKLF
ncbi:MAG: hypothetical protein V4642_13300 [Bacteroidota bacterium]